MGTEEDGTILIRSPSGRALCQKELAVGSVLPQMPSGPLGALAPEDVLPVADAGSAVDIVAGIAADGTAAGAAAGAAGGASNTDRRLQLVSAPS